LDVSFRETEPFYLEGCSIASSQGEQPSNEHLLQKSGSNEFFELKEITENIGGRSTDEESPINIELPLLTPLTNESPQC
jgi:hypothetical protein